jgi:hypothetical protein
MENNIKVIGLEYNCSMHGDFTTTSPAFWKTFGPWQAGKHFDVLKDLSY